MAAVVTPRPAGTATADAPLAAEAPGAPDVDFVQRHVLPHIGTALAAERERWAGLRAPWRDPVAALGAFLDGGKALRPRFCYWGHAAVAAGSPPRTLVAAAAALELLHAFALIHDDVMDGSTTRRGRPAMHEAFAADHAHRHWTGTAAEYGRAVATLTGDLAFALATRLATGLPGPALAVWHEIVSELTAGQYLDLAGTARRDRTTDLARTVARLKSGRYTVAGPLRLGAALAGRELPAGLVRYGESVGEAFQLRDDLLGVFGDPAVTGKPVGDDLVSGKATMLLAEAYAAADSRQRALLDQIGRASLDGPGLAAVTRVLVDTRARGRVEQRITDLVDTAMRGLAAAEVPGGVNAALRRLAGTAARRVR